MSEWREFELGDLCRMASGKARAHDEEGAIPLFGSNGLIGRSTASLYERGIVVGRVGAYCGSLRLSAGPFWATDNTIVLQPANDTNLFFLHFALKAANLEALSGGAAQPLVNQGRLKALKIRVPDLETQDRVAMILTAFDELIEINGRRIELLEDLARSLYREWFVRFRFPGHEDVELVDSELGLIPEGWEVKRLGDVVDLRYGKSLPAGKRRAGKIVVVSSAGIIDEHDEALVEGPGIVVGRKGNVGSIWWVDLDFFPIDTAYYVVTQQPLGLVYWQLRDMEFIDSHAAVPGLSRDQANALPLIVPSVEVAMSFAAANSVLFKSVAALRAECVVLAATRDLLLPRLVTGRLDISTIDLGALLPSEAA